MEKRHFYFFYVKAFCLLALAFLALPLTYGQYQGTDEGGNYILPSPSVWNFMRYGNGDVDLYTGTVSAGVPFYTIEDPEISIPISFRYGSNGLRPHQRTGTMGMGWTLATGGVITRVVNGIADERNDDWLNGHNKLHALPSSGIYDLHADPRVKYVLPVHYSLKDRNTEEYCEVGPDTYHFSFMGISGSFLLLPKGETVLFNTSVPAGELKLDVKNINTPRPHFTITTGDGYIYEFGRDQNYMDFQMYPHDVYRGEKIIYRQGEEAAITAWHLGKITFPGGRSIEFNYTLERNGGIIENYVPGAVSFGMSSERFPTQEGEAMVFSNTKLQLSKIVQMNRVLSSIKSDFVTVEFDYTSAFQGEIREDNSLALTPSNKLKTITVYNNQNRIIKKGELNYKYANTGNVTNFLFLDNIDIEGEGKYVMDYYELENFPRLGTYSVDHWGFYNGGGLLASQFLPTITLHYNYDETLSNDRRTPNWQAARKGMLKSILYPTKGKTVFEYEGHDHSKKVVKTSKRNFSPFLDQGEGVTGGVRVKRITDYTDAAGTDVAKFREFSYINETGGSSGNLLQTPRYGIWYGVTYTRTSLDENADKRFISTSCPASGTFDRTHIEYRRVLERTGQGGHTEYIFQDYELNPDDPVHTRITHGGYIRFPKLVESVFQLMAHPGPMDHRREQLTDKKLYDKNGKLVYHENIQYNSEINNYKTIGAEVMDVIYYEYELFYAPIYPTRRTTTEYFDSGSKSITREYRYNSAGQLIYEGFSDTDHSTVRIRRQFIADLNSATGVEKTMKDLNLVALPLKEVVTRTKNGTTQLIGGKKYTFQSIGNNLVKPHKIQSVRLSAPVADEGFTIESYLKDDITFDEYDSGGRLLHTTTGDGLKTGYFWGYNGQYIAGVCRNMTVDQMARYGNLAIRTQPLPGGVPTNNQSSLRALADTFTTFYEYVPLPGVSSITDPTGKRINYFYDDYGRLSHMTDSDNHMAEKYLYNYKR